MKIRPKRVGPYCKMEVQAEEKGKFSLHSGNEGYILVWS